MGHPGKNKTIVATTIRVEIANKIQHRAKALDMTKGAYLRSILECWYHTGAPPVSRLDAILQDYDPPLFENLDIDDSHNWHTDLANGSET